MLNDAMYLTTQPWAVHDSEAWKAPLLIFPMHRHASGIHSGLGLKAQRPQLQYKYLLAFKTWDDSSP